MGKLYWSDCLPAFILDLLSLLRGLARLLVCSFRLPSIHFTVPNVQPLSNCYLFPYLGTGGLKFGTEVIDLILNMICKGFISLFPCSRRGISFFFSDHNNINKALMYRSSANRCISTVIRSQEQKVFLLPLFVMQNAVRWNKTLM